MSFITSPGVIVPPLTAGGVAYGTGGQAKMNSAGTAGQFLQSAGAGVPIWATAGSNVVSVTRTSNTILTAANNSNFIDITSGTFTQTFTAAATLGSGWFCYIRNSGTGDITLDPNGAELIDGLANYVMYSGETRLVQCDGTAFTSIVLSAFYRAFTTSGTFTKPPGYSYFCGLAWSGGSSGQNTGGLGSAALAGGGGGCFDFELIASSFGATETVTIGAGGTASTGGAGVKGGTTSIGSLMLVYSTAGYQFGGSVLPSATGLTDQITTYEAPTLQPFPPKSVYGGGTGSSDASGNGVKNVYGAGCGGSVSAAGTLRTAGTSMYGGNGGAGSSLSNGVDGTAPGGGGGATQIGTLSGAGARGEVRIWGIA